jgi:hypothetical protein
LAPRSLEDEIEALATLGEVLLGVVDDVVCAERSDHVHVPRAAHAGHLGAERLGDLHGERPYAARRADDQDLVPRLDPASAPGGHPRLTKANVELYANKF